MQYLALLYSDEKIGHTRPADEQQAWLSLWNDYHQWLNKEGVTWSGEALHDTGSATTLRRKVAGKIATHDGPFAETKEQLGGYYLFTCDNLDEALRLASKCPILDIGDIEVRPVMDFSADVNK